MARSKFIRERSRLGWQLFWRDGYDPDFCDYTDCPLGQSATDRGPEPKDPERWSTWAAERAARPYVGHVDESHGFVFESEAKAKLAQHAADAAMEKRPLEEWEVKALAAGWRPPAKRKKEANNEQG